MWAAVCIFNLCISHAQGNITFVEIAGTDFFAAKDTPAALQRLRLRVQSEAAVLAIQDWRQSGRGVDFAVVFGLGLDRFNPYPVAPLDHVLLDWFGALPVDRILIVAKESELSLDGNRNRYDILLDRLRAAISDKQFIDSTSAVLEVGQLTVAGIDSSRFFPQGSLPEITRLADIAAASRGPIVLFSDGMDLLGSPAPQPRWALGSDARQKIAELISGSRVLAVFGAPLDSTQDTFSRAYSWWSPGIRQGETKKAWISPKIHGGPGVPGSIRFCTISADGEVSVAVAPVRMAGSDFAEKRNKLTEGDAFLAVDDYPSAVAAYQEAMTSSSRFVATGATDGLKKALAARKAEGRPLAQLIEFLKTHWDVGLIILVGLCAFRLFWSRGLRFLCRSEPFAARWRLEVKPKLKGLPPELFVEEFRATAAEITDLPHLFQGHLLTGASGPSLFIPPLDWAQVVPLGTTVFGNVDLGLLARVSVAVRVRFSWRLELKIYSAGNLVYAYATLWWGDEMERTWRVEKSATVDGLKEAARDLAYDVFSTPWVKP